MAKYARHVNSFADAELLYESIKPIRKQKLSDRSLNMFIDCRPTTCRTRQNERILKISRNKYALCDADSDLFYICRHEINSLSYRGYLQFIEKKAAILWTKHRDGRETMVVRRRTEYDPRFRYGHHVSRNDFLRRHLPSGFSLNNLHSNVYTIKSPVGIHHLPFNTFVPKHIVNRVRNDYMNKYAGNPPEWFNPQSHTNEELVYTRTAGGTWIPPNKEYAFDKQIVDRKKKQKLRPLLNEFYSNIKPLVAMITTSNGIMSSFTIRPRESQPIIDAICAHAKQPSFPRSDFIVDEALRGSRSNKDLMETVRHVLKQVMTRPECEEFIALAYILADMLEGDVTRMNTTINKWANDVFDLYKETKVYP